MNIPRLGAAMVAIGVVGLSLSVPAFADEVDTIVSGKSGDGLRVLVSYNDLNLVQHAAVSELKRRVSRAASEVCLGADGSKEFALCYKYAWNGARPQVRRVIADAQNGIYASRAQISVSASDGS
jgi:UrcA family protein